MTRISAKKLHQSTLLEKELRQKSTKKHSFRKRVASKKDKQKALKILDKTSF